MIVRLGYVCALFGKLKKTSVTAIVIVNIVRNLEFMSVPKIVESIYSYMFRSIVNSGSADSLFERGTTLTRRPIAKRLEGTSTSLVIK